ncbi:MAG: hypothetical protein ACFFB0_10500 [Promethearchaeota archaeon]
MKKEKDFKNLRNIKLTSCLTLILNTFCIIFGLLYILKPSSSVFWDFIGVIITITLFENLLFVYFNLHKSNKLSPKVTIVSYIYLIFIIIAILFIILGNLLLSSVYSNIFIENFGSYCIIYFSYFGILLYGIFFAVFNLKQLLKNDLEFIKKSYNKKIGILKVKMILHKILVILSKITFCIGIVFAIVNIFGSFGVITVFIAIISSQFGLFFSIIFLANTILLLKLKKHKRTTKKFYRTAIIGIFVSVWLSMPLFLSNSSIYNDDKVFADAFGSNWQTRIPSEANRFFLKTPFTLTGYYLGTEPNNCKITKNILFYDDEGISLYFDAYMPLNKWKHLPGENSTIIRIHGGSWVSGDKGMMNMMQMNKYFASQGYVVFDIQYGLDRNPLFELDPLTPDYSKGNFNIDDMMRHIGIFTNYIFNHTNDYNANLNSVFISGGSAGGHLACAVALAISSGNYTHIFNEHLKVKGLIPFYPANGQMVFFGINGCDEFKNPEKLIAKSSPPCLIFQGTHDILNYFSISENIQNTYLAKGNNKCAILWMPLAGHAADVYFTGYYNQIFLYYMERFMFLYH